MSPDIPIPVLELRGCAGVPAFTDEALFAATGVRIAFTGREGGVSAGCYASLNTAKHVADDACAVERNRAIALASLGISPDVLVVPNQVHGTGVLRVPRDFDVDDLLERAEAGADALVVCPSRVAVLMNFADCLPLILVSPTGRFAVVHAGWRGTLAHIAHKAACALAALDREAGHSLAFDSYNAYIGPHIGRECYEVEGDLAARFIAEFGPAAVEGDHVDLAAAVMCDLERAGLTADRMADAGMCTNCHPDRYFSYRGQGGTCGRQAAIACRMDP